MIIINGRFLTQKITGVQRYALEVCKRLPSEIGGHKVILVIPNQELSTLIDLKFEQRLVGFNSGQIWEQVDLPLFLQRNGNPLLINFVGMGPFLYRNSIMFLYDLAFLHHPEWFSYRFHKLYNFIIPLNARKARVIITDSNFVKQDIHDSYNIDKSKIKTVYAAHSIEFQNRKLKKEKYILTVSSIEPRKNLVRVIKAFSQLETDYKLIIVGSKNKTFSNSNFDEALLTDRIEFTGYVSDVELIEIYNKAEVFIYASLFEGFGIPPLEAQACGCPCIVSNVTSLPEVYKDSVHYCNPESVDDIERALDKLLRDKNAQSDLRIKGLENVTKFNWDRSTKEIENIIYEESINS